MLNELKKWIDPEGLFGNKEFPEKWSSGNAILETSFSIDLVQKKSINLSEDERIFILQRQNAILNCKSDNGLFNKNVERLDQITFDCLIGAAHSSRYAAKIICKFGRENHWIMSNTGKFYFTAISRPQYIAYYKICANEKPNIFQLSLLYLSQCKISDNPSGIRLQYLVLDKLKDYSKIGKYLYNKLMNEINKKYGSFAKVNENYYQNSEHPFARFYPF